MASYAYVREIHYHPNAGLYYLVFGGERVRFVDSGGSTVAQQIATHINEGAIDRRPGAPNQLVGDAAVHFLEALKEWI